MDSNTAYGLKVRVHSPKAEVFYVVAKDVREVLGQVRVAEAARLRVDNHDGRVVTTSQPRQFVHGSILSGFGVS